MDAESNELRDQILELFKIIRSKEKLYQPFELSEDIVTDFNDRINELINCLDSFRSIKRTSLNHRISLRIKKIKAIQEGISESLRQFLTGDIKKAYEAFNDTFSQELMRREIRNICVPLSSLCNEDTHLYRVRKSDKFLGKRNEMFHIPFEMRHLVKAQRYSVAGLPCLYLGSSIFICWQEMGKPDFDKLYISSFSTNSDKQLIVNFASEILSSARIRTLSNYFDELEDNELLSYLTLWPLIIACSYTKSNESSPFNQEYIIPNLLMQWISSSNNSRISGVAYRSTKLSGVKYSKRAINIVIPPKVTYQQTIENHYCPKLTSLFKLTFPVSWQVLSTLNYPLEDDREIIKAKKYLRIRKFAGGVRDFTTDIVNLYPLTDFYKLERTLDELFEHDKIACEKWRQNGDEKS